MNGATALPLVRTMSPPRSAIMMRMGTSQYFFRTRMKAQSSATKAVMARSELPRHGVGRGPRRAPLDPVGRCAGLAPEPQRVLAETTHEHAHRRHRPVEEERHHHRADAAVEQETESEP